MSIEITIEALSTPATQQAYVDLVGLLLKERQNNIANANITYNWLGNAITDISRIMQADGINVFGINTLESSSNWSNSLIQNNGSGFYDSGVLESFNTMPGNVGGNVFVTNSYSVLVPPKDFVFSNVFNSNALTTTYVNNYTSSILSNSNVYSNLNINTGLDYALSNTYLNLYNFSSNVFTCQQDSQTVEELIELAFAENKQGVIQLLGGGI